MRILHITDDIAFTGGIRSYIRHLADAAQRAGHAVEIYSPPAHGGPFAGMLSRWASLRHHRAVRRLALRARPDVVHAHSVSLRLSPSPLLALRRLGVPVVMTVHDFNYICPRKWLIHRDGEACRYGFGYRCLVTACPSNRTGMRHMPYQNLRWLKIALHRRLLARSVHTFICPSDALRQRMERIPGVRRAVHIPNFIAGDGRPPGEDVRPPRLLYVGRLSREKGVDTLLRALPDVRAAHPDAELSIIGDGPERSRLERLAADLGLGAAAGFVGEVDNERLGGHYADAACCVLPSLWMENCPVTALEALSFGTPLVGSDIGGLPEIIRDGENGVLFRRRDHMDLARKLGGLLGDRKGRREMRRAAYADFRERYTEGRHLDSVFAAYRSVIG